MPKITIFILVLVFTTSFEEVSYSWESDMHYGLTKWLAVKAGFKLDDAEIIAAGAESSDRSSALKASVIVPINICCGKSAEASRHVQHHHFPSDGYVPSPRYSRKVIPGHEYKKNSGNRWVRQEIAVPVITGINGSHNTNLNRFGQSLHPLGDSWSHQGVPDMPPCPNPCPENLVWSHSEERGGWASHDADLTHKYENDSVETAKAIYYYMEQYLIKNPNYGQPELNPWESLEPQVRKFAKMQTALEKRDWFDSHNDVPLSSYNTYPCFFKKHKFDAKQ